MNAKLRQYLIRLNVKEWVTIIYFMWIVIINLIFQKNQPFWYLFVTGHSLSIFGIIWLAGQPWFQQDKWRFIRDVYPYFIAILGYKESAYFVQLIFQNWYDKILLDIDYLIFQIHPTVWLAEHGSLFLNEYANFAYFSYFVYVPVLVYVLWKRKNDYQFERFQGGLVMAYNFSYIFFALLPASSPRFALPEFNLILPEAVRLKGYLFTFIIDFFMDAGAMRGGAFPSVHCCASTVFLMNVYLFGNKKYFWLSLILVLGMYWSTVYGRYHYVIDVLAGIGLGLIFTGMGFYFQSIIEKRRNEKHFVIYSDIKNSKNYGD